MKYIFNNTSFTDEDIVSNNNNNNNNNNLVVMEELDKRVKKFSNDNDWFFCSLYGLQNYGLATSNSDINCCLIMLPKEYQWPRTIFYGKGQEHVSGKMIITDYFSWFNNLKKPTFDCLELLFSKYIIVNKRYKEQWDMLINNANMIQQYDYMNLMESIFEKADSQYKKYRITHDNIDATLFFYLYNLVTKYTNFQNAFCYPSDGYNKYIYNLMGGKINILNLGLKEKYKIICKRVEDIKKEYYSSKGLKLRWAEYNYRPRIDRILDKIDILLMERFNDGKIY